MLLTNSVVFNSQQNNYTTTVDTTTADLLLPPLESIVTKIWCGYNSLNASLNVSLAVRGTEECISEHFNVVVFYHLHPLLHDRDNLIALKILKQYHISIGLDPAPFLDRKL